MAKKRAKNGKSSNESLKVTLVEQLIYRKQRYEEALGQFQGELEQSTGVMDRLPAQILQVRGALSEANALLEMVDPEAAAEAAVEAPMEPEEAEAAPVEA